MKKRLLSFLLCLAILAGQIPAAAFAAEDTPLTESAAAETILDEQNAEETPAPAAEEEPKAPEASAAQQPAPTGEAAPEQTPDQQPTQQPETEGSKGTEAAPTPEGQPVPPPENNVEDQGEAQPEQQPAEGAGPADANSEETEEQPGDSVVTYTITFTDELGTASDETGSEITQAAEGTLVTITAKDRAEEGLLFTAWQAPEGLELADDTEEITTFTMPDSDVELAAEYAPLPEDAEALAEEEEIMLADASPVSGDGTESDPVVVNTFEQLHTAVKNKQQYIKLGQDIDTSSLHDGLAMNTSDLLTFENQNFVLDLNGKTLHLEMKIANPCFIQVVDGSLTIKDSSPAKTGAITGLFGAVKGGWIDHLIFVGRNGSLTLEGGTFSVKGIPFSDVLNAVCCIDASVTIKDGVKLIQPEHLGYGYNNSTYLNGQGYALYTEGNNKVIIDGGEFDGYVNLSGYQDPNGSVQINGGTFKKGVEVRYTAEENNSDPAVTVNGGTFEGDVYLQYWDWKESLYMPYRLNGGTFKGTVNLHTDYYSQSIGKTDKPEGNPNIVRGLDQCFGYNAVVTPDGTFTGPDASTAVLKKAESGESYKMLLEGNASNPVQIIPNAWGMMESVTLDGKPIDYAKDWNGTPVVIKNNEEHTITFKWKDLADELKTAGYRYDAQCMRYTSGDTTGLIPTDQIPTGTEYSFPIKKGADPNVYSFDLRLDLKKDSRPVNTFANQHIVRLVVVEAPAAKDTFVSTVRFDLDKTEVGEPGELRFTAKDLNENAVAINPVVTWNPTLIQEGENKVSFKIPAPTGYTFVDETGKVTTLLLSGEKVIGNVSSDGALNYSFTCQVDHKHKAASVGYNAKYHWDVCSCGQQIMNTSAKHTMGAWEKSKDIPGGGEEYTRTCTHTGCGYTETTVDYSGVKHVTSLVLNMKNYPMDGMRPHNFVHQDGDVSVADPEIPGESFYKLTKRDDTIKYPSFSIATGNEKVKLSATNPEAYEDPAENPDFAKWTTATGTLWLRPDTEYSDYETEFQTNGKYKAHLTLDAKEGYAFYKDFKTNQDNFKLYTDMEGITIENYGVRRWYYDSKRPSYDDPKVPEGWGWYTQAPDDDSAGASRVQITFVITARNEGDLNITLPELKAGDDLKETWAGFEGTPNLGTGNFVDSCYAKNSKAMQWTGGPSCVIYNNNTTGESVIAQAGETYTLTIPSVNENVLAHITIKNPEAATKVIENEDGTITVTYTLPAAADNKIVHGAAVSVTAPAYGKAPSTTAAITAGDNCTASAVTWNPADAAFEAKAYTATVTLTPSTDYTFASDAAFTINGHVVAATKNADGSVTLSYTFPALAAPHTHNYDGQPYLYLDPGNHYQECKAKDGAYKTEAHDFSVWTANTDGNTHSRTCSTCHKAGETANYTETASHNWQWVVDTVATPNAAGQKHEECTDCHAKRSENTEIPMMASIKVENLTVAKPAKDATAAEATTTDSAYTVASTVWKAADGSILAVGQSFKPGTVYTASITLHSNSDAVFSANSTFNAIDGKNAAVAGGALTGDSYAYSIVLTYTFDATEGVAYHITKGANGVWVKGSTDTLSFTAGGEFAKFRSVTIDDTVLAAENYTKAAGSTVITLKNEYLSTLSVGAHKIAILFVDGDCSTNFTVHQHTYGAWSSDDTHHWRECTDASCPDKAASVIDKAEHTFVWKIDVPASQASTGTKYEECTVCGKKRSEGTVIDKLPGSSGSGSHHSSNNSNNNNNTGTEAAAPEAAAPAPAASAPVTTTTSARTGDSSNLIGWLAVLLISGGAAGAWYTVAKKKKEQ